MGFCMSCGSDKGAGRFCSKCGATEQVAPTRVVETPLTPPAVQPQSQWNQNQPPNANQQQQYAPQQYVQQQYVPQQGQSGNKIAAGLCGIFLGALGIHKFVLGYSKQGLVMLLVSVLTLGLGGIVMGIIGFIEGIIYLCKSDSDFHNTYVVNKKGWF